MTTRFLNFCNGFVLPHECGWPSDKSGQPSNDPRDPGGYTRFGIDQRSHPNVDVRDLTYPQALDLYAQDWTTDGCETMAPKLGEVFYDAAVNCGLSRAKQFLAASTGWSDYIDAREAFYRRLVKARPALSKFLPGWINRTADLRRYLA